MDCPRCRLSLRETDYEGVTVDLCDNCWGIWLDRGELEEILDVTGMDFSAAERQQFLSLRGTAGLAAAAAEEAEAPAEPTAPCPHCGRTMDQVLADPALRLVVDRCPEHGLWLDTGEIKAVQVVAERSADLHRMLLRKLGLRGG